VEKCEWYILILVFLPPVINNKKKMHIVHAYAATGIGLCIIGGDVPIIALLSFGDNCTPAGVLGGDVRQPAASVPSASTFER
jgi:hypothetical protein